MEDPALRTCPVPSHPQWAHLVSRTKTNYTCIVCGMDVDEGKPHFVARVIRGGGTILHPDDEPLYEAGERRTGNSDLGRWPVGPNCVKRFKLGAWVARHVPA